MSGVVGRHSGHHAPIFRRRPDAIDPPKVKQKRVFTAPCTDLPAQVFNVSDVTPLCVFAAGRQTFDAIVRSFGDTEMVKIWLFAAIPLTQNGWDEDAITVSAAGTSQDGFPIWRVSRG